MRLQLSRLYAAIVSGVLLISGSLIARADDSTKAPDGGGRLVVRTAARTSLYADTNDVTVVTPVATAELAKPSAGWSVHGLYLADIVSAASVDIITTASPRWTEVRHAGTLGASYETGSVGLRPQVSASVEPDYISYVGGGVVSLDLYSRSHAVFLGYFRSHDTIGRTGTSFDVFSRTLDADALSAGVTLTLNRSTHLSLVNDVFFERGDSSKPYRYVPLFSATVAPTIEKGESVESVNRERLSASPLEQLPLDRQRYALTARFGHRFGKSTLRVDERFYADSWSQQASTTEARYFVDVSRRLTLWPRARVHAQTGVSFWERAYVGALAADGVWRIPRFRTGDRELGPLATFGLGAGASFGFGPRGSPRAYRVALQLDAMHTEFFDTLYLTSRNATLATLGVEADFE
jgi:hypothetical protein